MVVRSTTEMNRGRSRTKLEQTKWCVQPQNAPYSRDFGILKRMVRLGGSK